MHRKREKEGMKERETKKKHGDKNGDKNTILTELPMGCEALRGMQSLILATRDVVSLKVCAHPPMSTPPSSWSRPEASSTMKERLEAKGLQKRPAGNRAGVSRLLLYVVQRVAKCKEVVAAICRK
jgi:hypothetical protein